MKEPCEDGKSVNILWGKILWVWKFLLILHSQSGLDALVAWHGECENSSVGRARPCQGRGRGFESRFSLTAMSRWRNWQTRYFEGVVNNGSCEFESHLGHQKVVGATALATFSFYPHPVGFQKLDIRNQGSVENSWGQIMQCCRIVNVIKNKNIKKQPWSNVECFAFGVGIVRFASLETSFHAANHTIPTPPSHEGSPHCPKDKNRSPFHGEKPLMTK